MYCRHCGAELNPGASVCPSCGISAGSGSSYCANCGAECQPGATFCYRCGFKLEPEQQPDSCGGDNAQSQPDFAQTGQGEQADQYNQYGQQAGGQANQYNQGNQYDQNNQANQYNQAGQYNQYNPYNQSSPYNQNNQYNQYNPYNQPPAGVHLKSKMAAGLLGIFLGAFGVHNFYLGYTTKAVIQLCMTVLSCGILGIASEIWGFIEGILILVGNINVDGHGMPLQQ